MVQYPLDWPSHPFTQHFINTRSEHPPFFNPGLLFQSETKKAFTPNLAPYIVIFAAPPAAEKTAVAPAHIHRPH